MNSIASETQDRPSQAAATAASIERTTKPVPDGMHTVTPHLVCAGAADAIEFYKKAFAAVECMRLPGPDGRLWHASIQIGDSMVMLMDEFPEMDNSSPKSLKGTPVTIHLYVEDADAVFDRCLRAGAKTVMALENTFWGDRYGVIEDPFGHRWSVATHLRDMSPDEIRAAAKHGCG